MAVLTRSTFLLVGLGALAATTLVVWHVRLSTPTPAEATFPGYTGQVAFRSARDQASGQIYVMNPDGSNVVRLTNSTASDTPASWSPDGAKIGFTSDRDGNSEIYSMNADGTGQTRLTNNSAFDAGGAWSSDGTKLAFNSDRDSSLQEIYVMDANGANQARVTNNTARDFGPDWMPGGNKIVFTSDRDGHYEIYVMNADGSGQTRLTNSSASQAVTPNWSPDGTKIAYLRDCTNEPTCTPAIMVMNANGSGSTPIVTAGTNMVFWDVAWSPDGARLFGTTLGFPVFSTREIHSWKADGTDPQQLTNNSVLDDSVELQPVVGVGGITTLPEGLRELNGPDRPWLGLALALAALLLLVSFGTHHLLRN